MPVGQAAGLAAVRALAVRALGRGADFGSVDVDALHSDLRAAGAIVDYPFE
jgi:hypothetical protein